MNLDLIKSKKLIIFDVDNTLVNLEGFDYIWELLNDFYELQKEDDILYSRFKKGEISIREWVNIDFEMYIKNGCNENQLMEIFQKKTSISSRTKFILEKLQNKGIKLGIVSGSIDILLKYHKIDSFFQIQHINKIYLNKNGKIIIDNFRYNVYDNKDKILGVKDICKNFNIDIADCIFIGDGNNDIKVCDFVNCNGGISIAFNGSDKLKKISTYNLKGSFDKFERILF